MHRHSIPQRAVSRLLLASGRQSRLQFVLPSTASSPPILIPVQHLFCPTAAAAPSIVQHRSYTVAAAEQKTQEENEAPHQQQHQHRREEEEEEETEEMLQKRTRVAQWLLIVSGMVFAIVVVGGLTRLEEGGLSMVEWKPLGLMPPVGQEEWEAEFERYKQFPEYKKKHMDITLSDFKYIFFWEYFHRQLGRLIGVAFVLPALYFWRRGHFKMPLMRKLHMGQRSWLITAMIGFQGALGWYMVKSGLDENHELMTKYNTEPRVSQYRLASHLGAAFVIYATTLWTYFDVKHAAKIKTTGQAMQANPAFRRFAAVIAGIVFLTVISGAFVAGIDAGLVYSEFPKMGGRWIPQDIFALSPLLVNFFENTTTVQFDHRVMATLSSLLIITMFALSRRPQIASMLNPTTKLAVNSLLAILVLQYSLGIATLLYHVPTPLASAHQTGSLTLFTVALWLLHCTRRRFVRPPMVQMSGVANKGAVASLRQASSRANVTAGDKMP